MSSSAVHTFTDPDEYAVAFRSASELTITERGQFTAKLTQVDLHRLWMQRYSDNLPRVAHLATTKGRAIISFATRPGPTQFSAGVEMRPTEIERLSEGISSFLRSSGSASWANMSLPIDDMASVGAAMVGYDLRPPRVSLIVTPSMAAMAKLQRLHAAAAYLAENAPDIITNPDASRGLEQALVEAMARCLGGGEVREDSVAERQHELIMRRFRRFLEENPDQPVYIPEICKVIGVSDRTLRVCCNEHFGMGPKRYLLLRRLNQARRALRKAAFDRTTVTDIATRYGFWHFGLFAGEYRSLFGESPSTTLHRQPD